MTGWWRLRRPVRKTGHYNGRSSTWHGAGTVIAEKAAAPSADSRKAPLGQDGQGIDGMPRCVIAYWTIRVNLVVAVWLPDVAVTVTV